MKIKFLGAVNLAILIGLLAAGLWPFRVRPENKVEWLKGKNGILFRGQGIVYSPSALDLKSSERMMPVEDSISLEIWLEPQESPRNAFGLGHILAFCWPRDFENLMIGQFGSELILIRTIQFQNGRIGFWETGLKNALPKGLASFITVTSSEAGTSFYLDGVRKKFVSDWTLTRANLSGRLVLGDSATGRDPWKGSLFGLAIYSRALTAAQVNEHYRNWTAGRFSSLASEEGVIALYPFDERNGNRVQNHAHDQPDLMIPPYFHVLKRTILIPPWKEFMFNRSHIEDIAVNIFGFVPLGFFLYAFLDAVRRSSVRRTALLTIATGGFISLAIELIQVYLPDRVSSLTDVITNTLGTALGVGLLRLRFFSRLLGDILDAL